MTQKNRPDSSARCCHPRRHRRLARRGPAGPCPGAHPRPDEPEGLRRVRRRARQGRRLSLLRLEGGRDDPGAADRRPRSRQRQARRGAPRVHRSRPQGGGEARQARRSRRRDGRRPEGKDLQGRQRRQGRLLLQDGLLPQGERVVSRRRPRRARESLQELRRARFFAIGNYSYSSTRSAARRNELEQKAPSIRTWPRSSRRRRRSTGP